MNYRNAIFVLLICLLNISSCKSDLIVESSSTVNRLNKNVSPSPSVSSQNQAGTISLKKIKPEVIVGSFIVNKGKITDNGFWSEDAKLASQDTSENPVIEPVIEVDVLNCAGFLSSATATYISGSGWEMKYISETVATDVEQKVSKCGQTEKDGGILTVAFGVLSENRSRKSITIKKEPDYEKIIKTLPLNLRKWAKISEKSPANYKKLFDEHINSGWTDLDGDGAVDLVMLSEKCVPDGEAICQIVMKFEEGKWKQIARIEPT